MGLFKELKYRKEIHKNINSAFNDAKEIGDYFDQICKASNCVNNYKNFSCQVEEFYNNLQGADKYICKYIENLSILFKVTKNFFKKDVASHNKNSLLLMGVVNEALSIHNYSEISKDIEKIEAAIDLVKEYDKLLEKKKDVDTAAEKINNPNIESDDRSFEDYETYKKEYLEIDDKISSKRYLYGSFRETLTYSDVDDAYKAKAKEEEISNIGNIVHEIRGSKKKYSDAEKEALRNESKRAVFNNTRTPQLNSMDELVKAIKKETKLMRESVINNSNMNRNQILTAVGINSKKLDKIAEEINKMSLEEISKKYEEKLFEAISKLDNKVLVDKINELNAKINELSKDKKSNKDQIENLTSVANAVKENVLLNENNVSWREKVSSLLKTNDFQSVALKIRSCIENYCRYEKHTDLNDSLRFPVGTLVTDKLGPKGADLNQYKMVSEIYRDTNHYIHDAPETSPIIKKEDACNRLSKNLDKICELGLDKYNRKKGLPVFFEKQESLLKQKLNDNAANKKFIEDRLVKNYINNQMYRCQYMRWKHIPFPTVSFDYSSREKLIESINNYFNSLNKSN